MGWETLEREIVLTTPHMGIVREKALTGKGKIVEDYYIISKGDVAMALSVTEEGNRPTRLMLPAPMPLRKSQ